MLQEMTFKMLAVKNMIKRNIESDKEKDENGSVSEEDSNTQSTSMTIKGVNDKEPIYQINTPFLIVTEDSTEKSVNLFFVNFIKLIEIKKMRVLTNERKSKAVVESKKRMEVYGDTDLLFMMGFHHVSKEFFHQEVPGEMHKYFSSEYLNRLK